MIDRRHVSDPLGLMLQDGDFREKADLRESNQIVCVLISVVGEDFSNLVSEH